MATIAAVRQRPADLFGQPRELTWLCATVFWEAFARFATQALLVLYMVGALFLPGRIEHIAGFAPTRAAIEAVTGHLSNQAFAVQLFGLSVGLSYFAPLLGGLMGDRLLGRSGAAFLGGALIALGQLALAFDQSFLIGLLLGVLGAGLISPNLFAQVGLLYPGADRRRDDGLQIFYALYNMGAFAGPLVCGVIAATGAWHLAFALAGAGMLIGLITYAIARGELPADPPRVAAPAPRPNGERGPVALLVLLVAVSGTFWIAQSQVWNVYNLWVRDHVDLQIMGWQMPVPWFQAVDAVVPVVFLPPVIALWRWQAARGAEPEAITKMAIGCLIFGASMLWLAAATPLFGARVPLAWALVFHLIDNTGWLFFTPIVVGLYARAAPVSMSAMVIGLNSSAAFVGSTLSGRLGGLYERMSDTRFWAMHAGIVCGGALVFLALRPAVRRMLARADAAALRLAPSAP